MSTNGKLNQNAVTCSTAGGAKRLLTPQRKVIIKSFLRNESMDPGRFGKVGSDQWTEELTKQFKKPAGSSKAGDEITAADVKGWLEKPTFAKEIMELNVKQMEMIEEESAGGYEGCYGTNCGELTDADLKLWFSSPLFPEKVAVQEEPAINETKGAVVGNGHLVNYKEEPQESTSSPLVSGWEANEQPMTLHDDLVTINKSQLSLIMELPVVKSEPEMEKKYAEDLILFDEMMNGHVFCDEAELEDSSDENDNYS